MDDQTREPRILHGQLELSPHGTAFRPARIVIELEDISRADAPSQVVARQQFVPDVLPSGELIPFTLEVPAGALDPRHIYSVRVHVDVNGSGTLDFGDYITMQSYPVLTRGYGDEVRVVARQVQG
jgi:putative lipoprotein